MDDGAEEVPLGLEPGSLAAGTTPEHRRENNQVNDNIDTLKLSKHKSQSGSGIVGVVIYECLSIPGRARLHFHAQLRAARLRSGRGGCLWLGIPRSAAVREGQRLRLVAWGKENWEERSRAMGNRHKELDGRRIKITVCTQFANIEKYPNLVQKNTLESISVVKSQLKYCYLTYQTKIWSKYIFTIVWDLGRGVAGILRSTDVSGTKKLFQCIRSDWKLCHTVVDWCR